MAGSYKLTRSAEVDLLEIWNYIAEDDVESADRQVRRIFDKFNTLAEHPLSGRARNDLEPGVRSSVVDSYVLFYSLSEMNIEILNVVHGSRDLATLFS